MGRNKAWSQDEIEYLEEKWGVVSVSTISKGLGRTETAVELKAKKIGLGAASTAGGYLTARQVSYLLGVDVHTVTDYWIAKCGLKGRKRVVRIVRKMHMIKHDDLMKWLKNNQDKWDSRRVELFALGQEPGWLKEKRKKDRDIPERRFQKWTKFEDNVATSMFRSGNYTYKQIGEVLNRSAKAVQKRLKRLDVWGTGEYIGDRGDVVS